MGLTSDTSTTRDNANDMTAASSGRGSTVPSAPGQPPSRPAAYRLRRNGLVHRNVDRHGHSNCPDQGDDAPCKEPLVVLRCPVPLEKHNRRADNQDDDSAEECDVERHI
jgi:hypothetical protein